MTVASTGKRRRQQMAKGLRHLAKRGRSIYAHTKPLNIDRPKAVVVRKS